MLDFSTASPSSDRGIISKSVRKIKEGLIFSSKLTISKAISSWLYLLSAGGISSLG